MFEDTALSFSDEEWLGLTAWQRELYRTVMRDTMELVTSLGHMFLKREEAEQTDCTESEETALTDITQIPMTPETMAPSPGEPFFPYPYMSAAPVVFPRLKTSVIQRQLEDSFTDKQPLITEAQKTLGQESPDPPDPKTVFVLDATPESKDGSHGNEQSLYCGSGPVLCGPSIDLLYEGDQTQDLLEDAELLTVIKVEEINEVTSLNNESWWQSHPEEPWDPQDGAAITNSHHPTSYYIPWTENQEILSPGTLQWTERTPGQIVEEGGAWITPSDQQRSTSEHLDSETFYKCAVCSRHYLQGPNHYESLQVVDRIFMCPTCYSQPIADQHVQDPPQQTPLPPFFRDGRPDVTDSTRQDKHNFTCQKCNHSFSQLIGLHRHLKTHPRNKTPAKVMAPPQRKVYRGPMLQALEHRETKPTTSSREAYSKLHQHLQISTAFLQQLMASTGGFQYD
ncbi:zinc finger protein 169-like isoform X2 [Dendropsophus ebraccatus]